MSPCGAQTIDTGHDRSRKQVNVTCSWIQSFGDKQLTTTADKQLLDRQLGGADVDTGLGLCFKGLVGRHRRDHQTRSRTCARCLEVRSARQAWRHCVFVTHADRQPLVSWSHQKESKAGSCESGASLGTVLGEETPACSADGACSGEAPRSVSRATSVSPLVEPCMGL